MDYTNIYNQLVTSRKAMNRTAGRFSGYETHHIIPKSLGGSNNKDNLVVLTPREHCLAHMLLARMYTGEAKGKMCYALICLAKLRNKERSSITSKEYDRLRKAHQLALQDPDYKALRSAATAKQWTPERRAAVAAKAREQWATGVKRSVFASDEYRAKKSKQTAERWQDPEFAAKQSDWTKAQWQDSTKRPNKNSPFQ